MSERPVKTRHIYFMHLSIHDGIVSTSITRRDAAGNRYSHSYAAYDWNSQHRMTRHLNRSVAAMLAFQRNGLNVDTGVR